MASKKAPLATFSAEIMDSAVDTVNGIRFTDAAIQSAYQKIATEGCTVEELAIPERTKKGVKAYEPWPGHAMAKSTGAVIDGTVLRVDFVVPDSRYGKMLMATADTVGGFDKIRFIPVGIGIPDADGRMNEFKLSYITLKTKFSQN